MSTCFTNTSEKENESQTSSSWTLVSVVLEAVNDHRQQLTTPSDPICDDNSIYEWLALGGDRIRMRFSYDVAYGGKRRNGCDLKSALRGESESMFRVEPIVRQTGRMRRDCAESFFHATFLILLFVQRWPETNTFSLGD